MILVTGGAGFIGSHVVEALLARGDEVICLDNFNDYYDPAHKYRNASLFREHHNCKFYEGDINESLLESIVAIWRPDKIVHMAAMVGVRNSIQHPELYESVNVRGLLNTLQVARRYGVSNFVFASSSSVYGADSPAPFREDAPCDRPIAPYAATKRAGELLCYTYHHLYGLACTCLRFFTVYGPRGRPDMAPYLFTRGVFDGRPLEMFGDGAASRDYTYVDDVVAGVLAALDANLSYEIINLGNSQTVRLRDFIEIVEELVGREAKIAPMPPQPGDAPHTCADLSKARRLLGYDPQTPLVEGMARFVEWYKGEFV